MKNATIEQIENYIHKELLHKNIIGLVPAYSLFDLYKKRYACLDCNQEFSCHQQNSGKENSYYLCVMGIGYPYMAKSIKDECICDRYRCLL